MEPAYRYLLIILCNLSALHHLDLKIIKNIRAKHSFDNTDSFHDSNFCRRIFAAPAVLDCTSACDYLTNFNLREFNRPMIEKSARPPMCKFHEVNSLGLNDRGEEV